jgi:uncharacterized membrane protein
MDTEHHQNATEAERRLDSVTRWVGRPRFLAGVSLAIIAWIGFNLLAPSLGIAPIERAPFEWLLAVVGLAEFYVVVLILITQRREEALAQHQAELILQLTLLSEQKTAKIIALLEELRRDSPQIHDRVDKEAMAMTEHVSSEELLGALKVAKASTDVRAR